MNRRRAALVVVLLAAAAVGLGCPKRAPRPPSVPPVVELRKEAPLRSTPHGDAPTVLVLRAHSRVAVPQVSDNWAAVITSDGHAGFIPREAIARRAVLLSTGPFPRSYLQMIADRLRTIPTLDLVGVEASDRTMPGSPAGGPGGARQLAAGYKAPIVIAVAGGGRQIEYEVDDLELEELLVNEITHDTIRLGVAMDEVRDGVARTVMEMPPAEGRGPKPSASPGASAAPTLPHPNAAYTPAPTGSAASPSPSPSPSPSAAPSHPNAAFTPAPPPR